MTVPPRLTPPPPATAAQRIGRLIRRERVISGLSQQTLADRIGIHQATLARWEGGRSAPTLARIDEVLEHFGVRLRLDVEPRPDPHLDWDREALRLGSMTPAERLDEVTGSDLATLMERAGQLGVPGCVDGQTAAWLQGVPGPPRRMALAVTPGRVLAWATLERVVTGAVDDTLLRLRMSRAEAAAKFVEDGEGLLSSIFGYVALRVVAEPPPTVRLCLREASEGLDRVEADVIRLDALAAQWQRQTP